MKQFERGEDRPVGRVSVDASAGGRTKQSFKETVDINRIMSRYERTGMLEHVAKYEGDYGDFTDVPTSYHEAMLQVRRADEMFMSLPAKVRKRFANDPGEFLAFVENPENRDEMHELGLLKPERAPLDDERVVPPDDPGFDNRKGRPALSEAPEPDGEG